MNFKGDTSLLTTYSSQIDLRKEIVNMGLMGGTQQRKDSMTILSLQQRIRMFTHVAYHYN